MSVLLRLMDALSFVLTHLVASCVDATSVISCFLTTEHVQVCVLLWQHVQLTAVCLIHVQMQMSADQMEGVALAIIFASMVLDRLPAAVYLDTPRLATTALVRTSHGCVRMLCLNFHIQT